MFRFFSFFVVVVANGELLRFRVVGGFGVHDFGVVGWFEAFADVFSDVFAVCSTVGFFC